MDFAVTNILPSPSDQPPFLRDLNEQQTRAVTTTEGPLLIVAGAGSGKTRVLTYRIAYILHRQLAMPQQILALTFTNKAAREMQERIRHLLPDLSSRLWMGTFHSVFAKILRMEGKALGYGTNFTIYDTSDVEAVIKRILTELRYDPKLIRPRVIQRRISDAKNQLILPQTFRERLGVTKLDQITGEVYAIYEERLHQTNAMDFDDLLIKPVRLFETHPEILRKYQQLFRYILIDEYQDTNHAQYKVTRMLAGERGNICVVGDDAQSIYSFRGADIRNILDFKKDYAEAVEVPLEQNYRSTRSILRCADSIIKRNTEQLEKTLWTENEEGEPITLMEHVNEREEAQRVARMVETLRRLHGYGHQDMAVLYRTNYQSRVFEEAFRREGVPYQLVGGLSFYQRKEIKDVLAYLSLLVNPEDEQSLLRVINEPSRGIGSKTIEEILTASRREKCPAWRLLADAAQGGVLPGPAVAKVDGFVKMIMRHQKMLDERIPLLDVTRRLMEESGYMKALIEENSHESLMRRDNIIELQNAIAYYEQANPNGSLGSFLQEISLITDSDKYDESKPTVTLMTVHASKGLEFPVVFIVGLEEDLFPMGARDGEEANLEEERRLFYVAITRARKHLLFSCCQMRYRFGDESIQLRSRFLDEVDPGVVRTETGATIRQDRGRFSISSSGLGGLSGSGLGGSGLSGSGLSGSGLGGSGLSGSSLSGSAPDHRGSGSSAPGVSGAFMSPRPAPSNHPREIRIDYDEDAVEYSGQDGQDPFHAGVDVLHPTFGQGRIISRQGEGEDTRVVVFFPNRGQKTLMLRAAKLRPLS